MRRAERAEIMAPAGAMEQLYAAVRCGADAVYLGAGSFNARRNAANFDGEALSQAVNYCHGRGVRVYVTVNTLVMDEEKDALAATLAQVAEAGCDAVIIQDLSVLDYCKRHYPTLTRFSSTQTVVHNVSGALELERLYEHGIRHFLCGMALGCDQYFAQAVLEMKREYADVTLEAAIPCDNQSKGWSQRQKETYRSILQCCDRVSYVSHLYHPGCMMERNRYMVDHAAVLLACFNGTSGGTMNTVLYAQRQGLEVIIIDL